MKTFFMIRLVKQGLLNIARNDDAGKQVIWYNLSMTKLQKLFKDKLLAISAGILSALTFQSIAAYSTLFLLPQTLVALITIFILIRIEEYKLRWLILASVFIFLMHYVLGALAIFVLWTFYLQKRLKLSDKFLSLGLVSAALLSGALLGLNFLGKWQLLNTEEAAHFNFGLSEKLGFIVDWYSLIFFFLFPLGFIYILKKEHRIKKRFFRFLCWS